MTRKRRRIRTDYLSRHTSVLGHDEEVLWT